MVSGCPALPAGFSRLGQGKRGRGAAGVAPVGLGLAGGPESLLMGLNPLSKD